MKRKKLSWRRARVFVWFPKELSDPETLALNGRKASLRTVYLVRTPFGQPHYIDPDEVAE